MDEHEREAEICNINESESYSSYLTSSTEGGSSEEESDEEVCYTTPSEQKKGKRVGEIFNANSATKDIKWKVVIVFVRYS